MRRGLQISWAGLRHLGPLARRQLRHARDGLLPPESLGRPLRLTFEDLGGTFIKFGQIMASSPGLFGEEVANEFRSLPRHRTDRFPSPWCAQQVEDDLGMDARGGLRRASSPSPSAGRRSPWCTGPPARRAGGGREGHPARHRPGGRHRPRSHAAASSRCSPGRPATRWPARCSSCSTASAIRSARRWTCATRPAATGPLPPAARRGRAAADRRARALPRVLRAERAHDGVPRRRAHRRPRRVAVLGVDPAPLVEQVVRSFFLTTVRWGAFHGDVHAGNMLVLRDGRIGVIDWGIVGRLDPTTHWFFLRTAGRRARRGRRPGPTSPGTSSRPTGRPSARRSASTSDQLADFIRQLIEPMLTRPVRRGQPGRMLQTTQLQVAKAQGIEAQQRPLRPSSAGSRPSAGSAGWPTRPAGSTPSSTGGPSCSASSSCTSSATAKLFLCRRAAHARPPSSSSTCWPGLRPNRTPRGTRHGVVAAASARWALQPRWWRVPLEFGSPALVHPLGSVTSLTCHGSIVDSR